MWLSPVEGVALLEAVELTTGVEREEEEVEEEGAGVEEEEEEGGGGSLRFGGRPRFLLTGGCGCASGRG